MSDFSRERIKGLLACCKNLSLMLLIHKMMSKRNLDIKPTWKTPELLNGESWWGEKTYF